MPTGVPIEGVREQLFEAAERLLARGGAQALTSRAVTEEAGVAKGVLHSHFPDFDGFLGALAGSCLERLDLRAEELRAVAGEADVTENLARALADCLQPGTVGIIGLVLSRTELRHRLGGREAAGVPVLAEITALVGAYLAAERGLGRLALDADVDALAELLVGGAYLRAAGQTKAGVEPAALEPLVRSALADLGQPLSDRS